jgi:hypothetical protein
MRVKQVTFQLENTIPLQPWTKDPGDQFANLRPQCGVTIVFDENDNTELSKTNLEAAKQVIQDAFDEAMGEAWRALTVFRNETREQLKPKDSRRG